MVDRSTIARHLLSDQSDPFNRQPLTMEMLEPDEQLAEEVKSWVESKRKELQNQMTKQLANLNN